MIVVECNADEAVIRSLGFTKRRIKHKPGKGNVLNYLHKKGSGIGIIDEDPTSTQPKSFNNYQPIATKESISLFKNMENTKLHIIQISPRLEEWLIRRAKKNKLTLSSFGLPNTGDDLHRIPHYERKMKFKQFLVQLSDVDSELKTIKDWIRSLIH